MIKYYVGDTLTVRAASFDDVSKLPLSTYSCTVDFFEPPKDPEKYTTDRVVDFSYVANYDYEQQLFSVDVETAGWQSGIWHIRVTLSGIKQVQEYTSVNLLA